MSATIRHPSPKEVALLVKVGDTSLERDRGWKKHIYAAAGIPCYWIVNPIDGQVEVHTQPSGPGEQADYTARQVYRREIRRKPGRLNTPLPLLNVPVDEKQTIGAYLVSLAAISTPEQYAAAAMPLIRRDSFESFTNKTYAAAIRAADKAQKAHLKAEAARLGVQTTLRRRK